MDDKCSDRGNAVAYRKSRIIALRGLWRKNARCGDCCGAIINSCSATYRAVQKRQTGHRSAFVAIGSSAYGDGTKSQAGLKRAACKGHRRFFVREIHKG